MDFLYHYTSIETLALIMSKRTIRFNCLKFVDDPEEKMAADVLDVGRLCLVSCWTDMYTPNMKGIRLKMKEFPFKEYPTTMRRKWKIFDDGENENTDDQIYDYRSYIDEQKIAKDNRAFVVPPAPDLIPITYTNDESLIKPQIIFDNNTRFDVTSIGLYKRSCWEFQSEWRYRIIFTPFRAGDARSGKEYEYEKAKHSKRIPYKEYYLKLSDDAFEGAEVVVGPRASEAELIIVKSLIEKYQGDYTIPVSKSRLLIN